MMDTVWQNLRLSVRGVVRTPGVSAAIVITLALGIGANAMMFGIVDRLLLSPPQHLADADRLKLVYLERTGPGIGDLQGLSRILTFPDYRDVERLAPFESVGAYVASIGNWTLGSGADAQRVRVQQASASFFPTLGVHPARGRFYSREEDAPGAGLVAVLSEEMWTREFGRDPAIIGRVLPLNRGRYEVIGIAPAGFTGAELSAVDIWLPLQASAFAESGRDAGFEDRGQGWIKLVARLKRDAALEIADAQMTAAHLAGRRAYVQATGFGANETRRLFTGSIIAARGPERSTMPALSLWLSGVSLVVLLIACANVANLLLARGVKTQRDLAIRVALGADRRRLVTQLMTEAVVLASTGALAALAVAWWSSGALHALLVPDVAFTDTGMTRRLVLFIAVAAAMTTVLAGLVPAIQSSRAAAQDTLRGVSRGNSSSRSRLREALMIGQVTLSVILLVGAGLFVRSLWRALATDVGFDYKQTLSVQIDADIDPTIGRLATFNRRTQLYRDALDRVSHVPGVRSAALSGATIPLAGRDNFGPGELTIPNVERIPQLPGGGPYKYAGGEQFFATLGLTVTRGRAFDASEFKDGGEPVAMVNETFARTVWPGLDPLSQCIVYNDPGRKREAETAGAPAPVAPCRRIVGVFKDIARAGLSEPPSLQAAYPALRDTYIKGMVVRAEGDPTLLIASIRQAVAGVSRDIRFVNITPSETRFDTLLGTWRLGSAMFALFGLLALLVATVGLFSLLAFGVAQRRRELGIRAALGADRSDLIRLVMAQAARLVGGGLMFGSLLALVAGRFLNGLLFGGVQSTDPAVYAGVILTLLIAGAIAGLVPAWRATSITPATAMETE